MQASNILSHDCQKSAFVLASKQASKLLIYRYKGSNCIQSRCVCIGYGAGGKE